MTLQAKLFNAVIKAGHSVMPMHHCPDGHYTDYDEWEQIDIDEGAFMVNFYSDGETFFLTAYPDVEDENGQFSVDYSTWVRLMKMPI